MTGTPIKELLGNECLPQKIKECECNFMHTEECIREDGFNDAIDQTSSVEVCVDVGEMTKLIWSDYWQDDPMEHDGDCVSECHPCHLCHCIRQAKSIAANSKRFLRLKKG